MVVTAEAANYVHKESRASVDYEAQLGAAHRHIFEEIFRAEFRDSKLVPDLDSARKVEIMELLVRLNVEQGITIAMVTHEPDMEVYVTRVVVFRDGRIVDEHPGGRSRIGGVA